MKKWTVRGLCAAVGIAWGIGLMLFLFETYKEQATPIQAPLEAESLATTNLLRYIKPRLDPEIAEIIAREIDTSSKKYSLPIELIIGIMKKESMFNPLAISMKGAVGLMQILPSAHPDKVNMYKKEQLYHIGINIDIGCKIFREYYDKGKSIEKALKRYVGGDVKNYIVDISTTSIELLMFRNLAEKEVANE